MHTYAQREWLITTFARYNAQINLSAIRDPQAIYEKQVLDSLKLTEFVNLATLALPRLQERIIADLGTWGGFPLLPLAMSYPDIPFVGIDARAKKLNAIDAMAKELGIHNISTLRCRAEDCRERFPIITARAVAYSTQLITWLSPLLVPWGHAFLYKLATTEEETDLKKACNIHRFDLMDTFSCGEDRIIYHVRKRGAIK